MNFGSPTDAARIRTEKVLEQSVTQVPIVAVQITKVYNICIPEALTFDQLGWVGGFICLVNDNRSSTGSNVSDFRTQSVVLRLARSLAFGTLHNGSASNLVGTTHNPRVFKARLEGR